MQIWSVSSTSGLASTSLIRTWCHPPSAVAVRCAKRRSTVEDVPGQAGWYKVDMKVRPHFKYMGAFFTLGLVGKLDKE